MSTSINLETDIIDTNNYMQIGISHLEDNFIPYNFGAIAIPLNDLLMKSNAPKVIDLISLDVEGAEIEVLKGIKHNEFRFKFICIECRDLPKL